ncbi:ABC transporter related protein [Syntrophothermus lipocalidus DSM 12680]|uniref:ABC transporter related protein n=1 Tax=Syntrophothermus lipocalidus (strain DSM 12680 / TGB-C1) TaxID=643648 RepID=D7CIG3_SYNLT|nr:ABC transporter related protein [Syntrophothermus lipocalidus DSM 12680]
MCSLSEESIVQALDLVKRFGNLTAVAGVSFSVRRGECFGLLGPNGAGKTSIVKMIYGLSPITSGQLWVSGLDVHKNAREVRKRIGVVPQEDALDPELTVMENLLVYSSYFRIAREEARHRAAEILAFLELEDKSNTPVENLSGGMKRRLTIGRALINRPELLILDEPTTGLDPYARRIIWQRLRHLQAEGTTILLTTHYLEEASQLCDRLVILHRGRIIEEGAPRELVARHAGKEALEIEADIPIHEKIVAAGGDLVRDWLSLGDRLVLFTDRGRELSRRLNNGDPALATECGWQWLRPANLEDVFLKLTGVRLEEPETEEDRDAD